jgi:hypothetical protein
MSKDIFEKLKKIFNHYLKNSISREVYNRITYFYSLKYVRSKKLSNILNNDHEYEIQYNPNDIIFHIENKSNTIWIYPLLWDKIMNDYFAMTYKTQQELFKEILKDTKFSNFDVEIRW